MLTGGRRAATEKVVEQGAKDYGRTSENEDTVAFHIRSSGQQGGDRLRENNHHDDYGSRSPQQDRADETRTAATVEKWGTVDQCREQIIDLLEGGREAFELRSKRYATA